MKIERFEDLNAWKEARTLYSNILEFTKLTKAKKDFVFIDQIRSAALSVMANVAEGFEASNNKEKLNFLNFARRSCAEVRSHLYAGLDAEYLNKKEFDSLYGQCVNTRKLISGFISYLRRKI